MEVALAHLVTAADSHHLCSVRYHYIFDIDGIRLSRRVKGQLLAGIRQESASLLPWSKALGRSQHVTLSHAIKHFV